MEFQNLQLSDEDLQSCLYPLRDGEAPLPVKYLLRDVEAPLPVESMWKEDVSLLAKFITNYHDEITLPTNEFFQPETKCYENLAFLLSLLKGH